MMISFHLPPMAVRAAVSGQPVTGFERPLPRGSFLASFPSVCSFVGMAGASVVEVRVYRIKPGRRDEFVEIFADRGRPAQEAYGIKVLGPLLDLKNPNVVVWIRSFPSDEDREQMKRDFYEGPEWISDLEELLMPMLDEFSVVVAEAVPGALEGTLMH